MVLYGTRNHETITYLVLEAGTWKLADGEEDFLSATPVDSLI